MKKKKENNDNQNNNSIKVNNNPDQKKSLENKISEHKEIENNSKQQNSGDKIRQSKSNKLINSINDKIKEEEKKEKEKEDKKGKKDEENIGYSKNFKTMKVPKKNQNNDRERKSLTPFGDTPMGDPAPKMKVSKESMIKISTEPVANFYSIVKDLGHGSYGQVKKVKHKELGEIRAMKITNKKSESSKYEIEILKKISHPNITKIFEIFADSKKYYIIMEFLEGGELFEAITNIGSFTENSACKVMKQILSAVLYLHSNHIVHRDLKPENIMLTQKPKNGNYQIKLIDFGTAKIFRPGKKMNKFIGTSYYIAPEVLKERYDEKCDVWSCGVILFILLCGYPPFNGNTNVDIFHAIQNQNPIFGGEEWEDITSEAKDLIKLMLKKNPNERLSAEQCLTHRWFKIMESSERNKNPRISKQIQLNAIQHMAQFVHENRFKQAVLQFISTQFNLQKEENELKELFKSMDVTGTGQLTKDEFTKKLMELYGENDGKEMATSIFNSLDMDGSGKISYDEFLSAMINSQKVVTEERLKKAFKMFDKDNSGKLSVKEIRNVFGGTEAQWKQVINEVDLNNDGEVDFEEFKIMMVNMDKNQIIERKKSSEKSKGVSEVD
jgi:calcium-dependent protein kinase